MIKNKALRSVLFAALFGAFLVCLASFASPAAHAQTIQTLPYAPPPTLSDPGTPPSLVTASENFATPFIISFAQSHAWLTTLVFALGALRLVFKPITSAIEIYVKNSPSTTDDALVAKVESSIWWKIFFWLLDYGASIKAGTQAAKPTTSVTASVSTGNATPSA